ncbi:Hachiman antiphage defense system protein HamA [Liquorilactobacillus nagelii]|uniref:Hachiman antiphage defense system protein HamA n=2 Tax=Liquorilactobacillus nagelii TaxID=82688 RepID=UPI001FD62E91|nr:Hachiman antiphage defense system protein HamA [Liquorilactobacillus nagelii]
MGLTSQGKRQLILGVSQLSNNLENAISNVVKKIANFDNNQSNEMVLANDIVDRSIIYTQFGESKSKAIIKLIAPTETDFEDIASYCLLLLRQVLVLKKLAVYPNSFGVIPVNVIFNSED